MSVAAESTPTRLRSRTVIQPTRLRDLTELIGRTPNAVFPRHMSTVRPGGSALAVLRDGVVVAARISPLELDVPFVPEAWIVGEDREAIRELLHGAPPEPTSVPEPCAGERLPDGEVSFDLHLRRDHPQNAVDPRVQRLTPERLDAWDVPDDVGTKIGPSDLLPPRMFGLIEDGRLLALSDAIIDLGDVCAIQQVYVAQSARGRGLAKAVVASVADAMLRHGRVATYLVEEANAASVAVALGAGFVPMERRCLWRPPM